MIDAVSTLSLQGTTSRVAPQQVVLPVAEPAHVISDQGFVSSRIRVDNLQNVAILEYRSEAGEVIQQYPTQAQIDAFKRAQQGQAERQREAVHQPIISPPAIHTRASAPTAAPVHAQPVKTPSPPAASHGSGTSGTHSVVA